MMHWLKRLLNRKPKGYLLDDKYEIIPAFKWNGETYYMHKDPLNTLAGRGLTSMMFYEELLMRCDVTHLKEYCQAVRAIFSDPKKIDILKLAKITNHLEERINFLAAIPDHVFKLASVVFFTKNESPFRYDLATGNEKIKAWEEAEGMYDFFLQTPLKDLIPSLALPEQSSSSYLAVQQKINDLHKTSLREALSSGGSTTVSLN